MNLPLPAPYFEPHLVTFQATYDWETLREIATWKREMGSIMISVREMDFQGGKYPRINVQWKAFILTALNLQVLVTEV
jgi:hypothetical protein